MFISLCCRIRYVYRRSHAQATRRHTHAQYAHAHAVASQAESALRLRARSLRPLSSFLSLASFSRSLYISSLPALGVACRRSVTRPYPSPDIPAIRQAQ